MPVVVSMRNPDFAHFFFIHEHFERFLTTTHRRTGAWWYFLPLLALGMLPWTSLLPGALWRGWQRQAGQFQPGRFLVIWAVLIFLFFSASSSKLPSYILPIFPALALLCAQHLLTLSGRRLSWHAALAGKYMIEQLTGIPVEVDYASEFRYRNPVVLPGDVVFVISQSGETADTLAALREAKAKGAMVLGIVNVVGSTIARATDAGVYIHAGPEIGVASTKAFTSQLAVLSQIALLLARHKGMSKEQGMTIARDLHAVPEKIEKVLAHVDQIKEIAAEFRDAQNFIYLGRGINFPTALEGALKLKEISYIHAEGYPAAEMKHGPIALIDENMPVVFIVPKDAIYEKVLSNVQEVRARKGRIIAIANEDDTEIAKLAEFVIRVPRTLSYFGPIVNSIPLQLLAYYTAVARGCNVDQPRNLAKSVTVE